MTSEFTQIFRVLPGHGAELRMTIESLGSNAAAAGVLRSVGTLHEARWVLFDNDTRLLFASSFDGDWDMYIDDFARLVGGSMDVILRHVEGYPGFASPLIRDFLAGNQASASWYFRAYPDGSVKQIRKAARVSAAFQEVLDTPEFAGLLDEAAD